MNYSYWVVGKTSYIDEGLIHNCDLASRFDLDHKFNSKDIDKCTDYFKSLISKNHPSIENINIVITFFGLLENE